MRLSIVGFAAALALGASGAGAAQPGCNRECLAAAMSNYLQALVNHDPARMSVTRSVKYTENGVRLNLGDGLWQTASAMPTYRLDVVDDEADEVGLLGRISEHGNNNWFAVRLKVEPDAKISEIETLINRSISPGPGAGPPGANPGNTEPNPLMAEVIPAEKRLTRAELARIGNSYFTGMADEKSGANVPFSPLCQQPITFYIAEVFKIPDGKIRQIEAVLTTVPFRMESGW